jgi:hypothetical protein
MKYRIKCEQRGHIKTYYAQRKVLGLIWMTMFDDTFDGGWPTREMAEQTIHEHKAWKIANKIKKVTFEEIE